LKTQTDRFSAWQAELSIRYRAIGDRTVLAERKHCGPLHVQKSLYPEQDVCHTYILHPPGGVAGGDQLTINVVAEKNAHALITTPASNKFYRTANEVSIVRQSIDVSSDAIVEWLPQDSIMFAGCQVDMRTRVNLEQEAKFIGWEITCLGRPASGETFSQGCCKQKFELYRNYRPLHIETASIAGGGEILNANWGLAGYTVTGLMLVSNADKNMLELARTIDQDTPCLTAVTLKGELLLVRCLARQGMEARDYLTRVWSAIRPQLLKREATIPRVWHT
jgi:urease accessory protein